MVKKAKKVVKEDKVVKNEKIDNGDVETLDSHSDDVVVGDSHA